MWNRKNVKAKGKASMKANFWKCVATALILGVVAGGVSYGSGASPAATYGMSDHNIEVEGTDDVTDEKTYGVHFGIDSSVDLNEDPAASLGDNEIEINDSEPETLFEGTLNTDDLNKSKVELGAAFAIILVVATIAALVLFAFGFALQALLFNPLELGCKRFFRKNLDEPANLSNVAYAFDHNYKNIVKVMFLRSIYTFLWSLLFVIPGIVKSYEYRLIPYILSENPDMKSEEAFALRKQLMTGNKWKAFVYDFSFIGWQILSALTCGIVGIFYVDPYKYSSDAALYEAIRYGA
jgi:uncharacterized membrane protein